MLDFDEKIMMFSMGNAVVLEDTNGNKLSRGVARRSITSHPLWLLISPLEETQICSTSKERGGPIGLVVISSTLGRC